MNIFVTGGTGFLGNRLIKRLIKENHTVSALARSSDGTQQLKAMGVQHTPKGDLGTLETWKHELKNSDYVIHCAAPVEFWGPWKKFYTEITLATQNLAEAASQQGVKRFIYISSESVLQNKTPLVNINETHPYTIEPNSFYGKSKQLAEKELLKLKTDMKIIILRPPHIWGKGDRVPDMLESKIKTRKFIWVDQGNCKIETVHVENVVEAITLALTHGADKGIYFVTDDEPITVKKHFTTLLSHRNIKIPNKSIPGFIARPLSTSIEAIWKCLKIKSAPPISRFDLSFVALPRVFDLTKIKTDLGYKPIVNRSQGLREFTSS
jgi:2-alkyl-3-oxoalkanoate reductase